MREVESLIVIPHQVMNPRDISLGEEEVMKGYQPLSLFVEKGMLTCGNDVLENEYNEMEINPLKNKGSCT
jgi:hypothetical protein